MPGGGAVPSIEENLAHILSPDGVAFVHHSNMGAYVDPGAGTLAIENRPVP